jgi:hypothetical protein
MDTCPALHILRLFGNALQAKWEKMDWDVSFRNTLQNEWERMG